MRRTQSLHYSQGAYPVNFKNRHTSPESPSPGAVRHSSNPFETSQPPQETPFRTLGFQPFAQLRFVPGSPLYIWFQLLGKKSLP